jgi:hypothetical protein
MAEMCPPCPDSDDKEVAILFFFSMFITIYLVIFAVLGAPCIRGSSTGGRRLSRSAARPARGLLGHSRPTPISSFSSSSPPRRTFPSASSENPADANPQPNVLVV